MSNVRALLNGGWSYRIESYNSLSLSLSLPSLAVYFKHFSAHTCWEVQLR